jgi:hypothetical protein
VQWQPTFELPQYLSRRFFASKPLKDGAERMWGPTEIDLAATPQATLFIFTSAFGIFLAERKAL